MTSETDRKRIHTSTLTYSPPISVDDTIVRRHRVGGIHRLVVASVPASAIPALVVLVGGVFGYWGVLAYRFSAETHPAFPLYRHRLSPGWIFGLALDNSDAQYASFRNNIPALCIVMMIHAIISTYLGHTGTHTNTTDTSRQKRIMTSLVLSTVFLSALFGLSIIKIIIICITHYTCIRYLIQSRISPRFTTVAFTWCFGVVALFVNSWFGGYRFGLIHSSFAWMDGVRGLGMRWHITFNFTVLRMISFATDYAWRDYESPRQFERHKIGCDICANGDRCQRGRIESPHPESAYGIVNYFAYLFYAPLYMAGPILCFNDFIAQMHHPSRDITPRTIAIAAFRWIAIVGLMEIMLHVMHVVAIKDAHAWKGFSVLEIYALGYWNLKLIWLKLLIIWRFFRLWALTDHIETVENMTRCMTNHYSAAGFWRAWHRSYNRWIIRYLYIPLGGNKHYILNIVITFTFVALWHDIELRLVMWGWLIALFILPEVVVSWVFCTDRMRKLLGHWHLHLCALGAVGNILMMMIANIIGFVVGIDGLQELAKQFADQSVLSVILQIAAYIVPGLFMAAHIMFFVRANELERGIND